MHHIAHITGDMDLVASYLKYYYIMLTILVLCGCTTQEQLSHYHQIGGGKRSDQSNHITKKSTVKSKKNKNQKSKKSKTFVTVSEADTLYALSKKHGVLIHDLIEINHLSPPYQLSIGQKIYLPQKNFHIVRTGDTLYSIAKTYGVRQNQLAQKNNLKIPWTLSIGQNILLPGRRVHATNATLKPPARQQMTKQEKEIRAALEKKKPQERSVGKFLRPIGGTVISRYGPKNKGLHNDGINIQAPRGTPIRSIENGIVVYHGIGIERFGQLILIKHADGWISAYGHTESGKVKKGDQVKRGQAIASVGMSGCNINTPQLHLELRHHTKTVNPEQYI